MHDVINILAKSSEKCFANKMAKANVELLRFLDMVSREKSSGRQNLIARHL